MIESGIGKPEESFIGTNSTDMLVFRRRVERCIMSRFPPPTNRAGIISRKPIVNAILVKLVPTKKQLCPVFASIFRRGVPFTIAVRIRVIIAVIVVTMGVIMGEAFFVVVIIRVAGAACATGTTLGMPGCGWGYQSFQANGAHGDRCASLRAEPALQVVQVSARLSACGAAREEASHVPPGISPEGSKRPYKQVTDVHNQNDENEDVAEG